VRDPSGVVTQDPDAEVRSRIALVFSAFLRERTAVRVVGLLRARGLALPRRDRRGDMVWRAPTIAAVTTILRNPAYAGAFVYGRTRLGPPGAHGRQKQRRRSPAEWRIVVKDRYPAYVDWETFERIGATLADNRADYMRVRGRGIPRDGAALLHGITWCGECGHKMTVSYKRGSTYACAYMQRQHGSPHSERLQAAPIEHGRGRGVPRRRRAGRAGRARAGRAGAARRRGRPAPGRGAAAPAAPLRGLPRRAAVPPRRP
jgi:hypothetical protein